MTEKELHKKFIELATTRMSLFLKINEYKDTIAEMDGCKSPIYSHTSSNSFDYSNSKVSRLVLMIEEFEGRIDKYKKELDECMNEFEELLTPISLTAHMIFRLKYLNRATWKEISVRTGYCERQVRRIHQKELTNILEFLKNKNDTSIE